MSSVTVTALGTPISALAGNGPPISRAAWISQRPTRLAVAS
jgi:hypothetical protein